MTKAGLNQLTIAGVETTESRLRELESVVSHNEQGYVEVGRALREIKRGWADFSKFAGVKSFDKYAMQKWGWDDRTTAYLKLDAVEVYENVESIQQGVELNQQNLPSFTQALAMKNLEASEQRELASKVKFADTTVQDIKDIVKWFEQSGEIEAKPKADFRFAKSPNGHSTHILKSWLQKAIRRSLEEDAVYCAVELDLAGFPGAVWNTIAHVVSEDIGLAEPNMPANIGQLYAAWKRDHGNEARENTEEHKPTEDGAPERLYMIHAVLLCSRAKKSRLVDNMLNVFYTDRDPRETPDWVYDKHTREGQEKGRGFEHFFDEGAKLANKADIDDPYEGRVKELLVAREQGVAQ